MSKAKAIKLTYDGKEEQQLMDLFLAGEISQGQFQTILSGLTFGEKKNTNARNLRLHEVKALKDVTPQSSIALALNKGG